MRVLIFCVYSAAVTLWIRSKRLTKRSNLQPGARAYSHPLGRFAAGWAELEASPKARKKMGVKQKQICLCKQVGGLNK